MQQPWEKEVEEQQAAILEDLRSWRALLLPLSALANALFFAALDSTGGRTATTVYAFIAASVLSIWTVALIAQIDALQHPS